ncbi:MAG: phage tail tape measure protein [Methanobacterium sp.]
MAGSSFEFDMGFNFSEAINKVKSFAKDSENALEKLLNPKMNLDSSNAKKALDDLTKDLKNTQTIINGINVPTNDIKKMADEFNKVQKSASQSINEQKQALAQMVISGQKGSKEFADLEKQLKDNVQASKLFEKSLNDIEKELTQLDGKEVDVKFDKSGENFKSNMGNLGKTAGLAAMAGGAALAAVGIKKVIDIGFEYQKSLADFSAITGVQGKALDGFGESAKKLASEFGGSALDQITTFKGILSRLGPDIAKSPEALEQMTKAVNTLSLASGMDAAQSMDAMTTAALQFGVDLTNPKKAADEMTKMINVMAAGAKEGAAEIPQISEALAVSGAVARASGVSFLELNAGIQVMAQGGKYGAEAGSALRNVMVGMQEVSEEGSASLSKLGINSKDLATALQTGGLGGALKVINDKFGESSDQIAKNQVLIDLFGKENIAAGATLVAGANNLETFKKKMDGTNVAFEQAKTNSKTFSHEISLMKANLENVGLKLFDSIKPALDSVFKLFQDPKLMKGITDIVSNIAKGIAPIVEMLGTTLAPILLTVGKLIGEVFGDLIPPIMALIEPILKLASVLLDALMPVFKSMLPVFGQLIQSLADLLVSLMPLINIAIPLLITSLNVGVGVMKLVTYAIIGIADGLTWLVTAITDSIKWIGDLFNSIGKLLGLNPAKKQNEHNESLKAGGVVSKEFNKAMGTTVQQQQLFGTETNKSADATKSLTKNVNENTTNLNTNTGATKANAAAKKTLLEQLTELTAKVGATKAIESKIFSDYVIEFNQSAKQKDELSKATKEAERLAGVLSREIQPLIESQFSKEPLVIPLEHLELTSTGVNYKPTTDNIKLNFQESLMNSLDSIGDFLQPIPFDIVDTKEIDKQISDLKDSYNKGETDYETYTKKLKELDDKRAESVITTSDMISNSLMTVSNAMQDMAATSLQKFKETGKGLNDFLGQAGIAVGTMLGAALTSSEDQQKQILIQAVNFAEKLLSIYAVEIIALFTKMIPIPYVGTAAGVAAVAGLYTLLEVAKAKIGADQGVIDINSNYSKPATSRDTIPIWVRNGESVLTPEETLKYKEYKTNVSKISVINNNGDYHNFAKVDYNAKNDFATLNELSQLRKEVISLRGALQNQRTEVYDKREVIISDNRKVIVKNLPIYG